jgi:hypothetical protein
MVTKRNLYENKNEINCFPEDLGGDLPVDHLFSLLVWRGAICLAIDSKDFPADVDIGPVDSIRWYALRGFDHSSDFSEK